MADAVFTACFLNMCNRNCDIVGMANFAPIVNTRGCIYTHEKGIVLRSTYYVFDLYVNYLGDQILDSWTEDVPVKNMSVAKETENVKQADVLVTSFSNRSGYAVAAVNKQAEEELELVLELQVEGQVILHYISGESTEAYNDIDREMVTIQHEELGTFQSGMSVKLRPHSVNIIQILEK